MNKKGAIELSMTTIIIIIIGITILVLGLMFVTDLLGGAQELGQSVIEGGKEQVRGMIGQSTDPLSLYTTTIEIEQGGEQVVGVVVLNDGTSEANYKLEVVASSRDEHNIDCYILDSDSLTDEFTLKSGSEEDEIIAIQDTGNTDLGSYSCKINLYRDGEKIEDSAILIKVVPEKGFL